MNNIPEFVKWADDDFVESAKKNVIKRYGVGGISSNIDVEDLKLKDLRELATVVAEIGYDNKLYDAVGYADKHKLEDKLNKEFDRRLGEDAVKIYNMLDKRFNKEKWGGEVRYHIMNLCNRKGYSEMSCLKNTVWIMNLMGKTMDADVALEMSEATRYTLYWSFNKQKNLPGEFTDSEEIFKIHNEARKKEIRTQDMFVDYCLNQEFDKAYELIKADIDKCMKR